MAALLVKCDWAYLKEKPHNVTPNAFRHQPFLSTLNSTAMNHVLPKCSILSDQTKAPILGGLWIVPPIYIDFIIPIERLSIYQSTTRKNLTFSNKYHYKLGVQCLPKSTRKANHKHTFGRFATTRLLKPCSLLVLCTLSPSSMNVRRGFLCLDILVDKFFFLFPLLEG